MRSWTRRSHRSLIAAIGAALAVLVALPVGASAYFSSNGTATGAASVGSVDPPSNVTAQQTGADVTISWSAATVSSGGSVQGYTVKRSDGTTVCGSPTLVTGSSCPDANVPGGSYTYTVTAVYHSFTASATSGSITILSAPTIASAPSNPSAGGAQDFSFTGGGANGYQCQLDGGSFTACSSPVSYTGLGGGSHTFSVQVVNGASTSASATYTWTVDTAPTDSLSLAPGASNAFMSGNTVYFNGNAPGSFQLTDAVSNSVSAPASATFPAIGTPGWAHNTETVSAGSGSAPTISYTSSPFSWTTGPSNPTGYTVSSADALSTPSSGSALTFVDDTAAPAGGALTVNGSAASSAGSASTSPGASFSIARTDYSEAGSASQSGLQSSTLTLQSEALTGTTCGTPGSGGPFTTPVTITGTVQPPGIVTGYCYLYTLTGTDNVGNTTAISTDVQDTASVVTNGGFETGALSGWTVGLQSGSSGSWYTYTGTLAPTSHYTIAAPPQGTYAATTDQTGRGAMVLYQNIAVPAGVASTLHYTLYYNNRATAFHIPSPATLSFTGATNQQYRVDLITTTASTSSVAPSDVLANLFQTTVSSPLTMAPTAETFALTPWAGQTVRLRFAMTDTSSYFQASVDAVSVTIP
jgi:hypothetical protein